MKKRMRKLALRGEGVEAMHEEIKQAEDMRPELVGYCYRMLGAFAEAEDAVQDTMVRVWQSSEQLLNRASIRAWIYRIATNVCLDKLRHAKRRALPMDLSEPAAIVAEPRDNLAQAAWIWPFPDAVDDPAQSKPSFGQRHYVS